MMNLRKSLEKLLHVRSSCGVRESVVLDRVTRGTATSPRGSCSVYSPSTWPSTASSSTRPRTLGGSSALYTRMRHVGPRPQARATRAAPTRARPGTRPCGSRPRAPRSGRSSAASPRRSGTPRSRASRTAPNSRPRLSLASAAHSDERAEHDVDRARDAPALDVGEHVRPDVRGDVEILGQLVARIVVGFAVGRVVGHGADATRATPLSACRSRCAGSRAAPGPRRSTVMKLVSPFQRGSTCTCRWPGTPAPAARPRLAPTLTPSGGTRRGSRAAPAAWARAIATFSSSSRSSKRGDVAHRRDHQVARAVRDTGSSP